jgi:hypothetical protein
MGLEERVVLRTELVRAAAGAIPGADERTAFASAVVEAVRATVPAPPPPPVQPDALASPALAQTPRRRTGVRSRRSSG